MMTSVERSERERVVAAARSWIGTPFHHGARIQGAGVDCANLLAAVYATIGLHVAIEWYPTDWFLHESKERLLHVIEPLCFSVDTPTEGDIALFRFGRTVSHAGIVGSLGPVAILHAFTGRGVVIDRMGEATLLGQRFVGFYRLNQWAP